jgi:hypothetical protein
MSLPPDPELYSAWTKVSKKKKERRWPPQEDNTGEAKLSREDSYWLNPTLTSNRYSTFSDEDSSEHHQISNIEITLKPPPKVVSNVTTVSPLIQLLEQIRKLQYEIKALSNHKIRIQPKTPETEPS